MFRARLVFLAFTSALVSSPALAALPGNFVIPGSYRLAPILELDLFPDLKTFYKTQLARALWTVKALPPAAHAAHPFVWEGDSSVSMEFYVSVTFDPTLTTSLSSENQSSRVQVQQDPSGKLSIRQIYFFDRIFFHPDRRPKSGPFIELVSTAAYLIYGVIPHYVQHGSESLRAPLARSTANELQIVGTQHSIQLLERLMEGPNRDGLTPDDIARFPGLLDTLKKDLIVLKCQN